MKILNELIGSMINQMCIFYSPLTNKQENKHALIWNRKKNLMTDLYIVNFLKTMVCTDGRGIYASHEIGCPSKTTEIKQSKDKIRYLNSSVELNCKNTSAKQKGGFYPDNH